MYVYVPVYIFISNDLSVCTYYGCNMYIIMLYTLCYIHNVHIMYIKLHQLYISGNQQSTQSKCVQKLFNQKFHSDYNSHSKNKLKVV